MQGKQSNKLNMFRAVSGTFEDNPDKVGANAMLNDGVSELNGIIGEIDERNKVQSMGTEGTTSDKRSIRTELVVETLVLYAACRAVKDPDATASLQTHARFCESKLQRMGGNRLLGHVKSLLELASHNSGFLLEKNYTSSDLAYYESLVEQWGKSISKPRQATGAKKNATQSMAQLLKEGMALLEGRVDGLMKRYRRTDPDFCNAYFAVRTIVDLKGARKRGVAPVSGDGPAGTGGAGTV